MNFYIFVLEVFDSLSSLNIAIFVKNVISLYTNLIKNVKLHLPNQRVTQKDDLYLYHLLFPLLCNSDKLKIFIIILISLTFFSDLKNFPNKGKLY